MLHETRHLSQYVQSSTRAHISYHSLTLRSHGGLAGKIVCHMRTNFNRSLTITANACGYNKNFDCSEIELIFSTFNPKCTWFKKRTLNGCGYNCKEPVSKTMDYEFDPTCTQSHMSLKGLDMVVSLSQEGTHKLIKAPVVLA